MKKVVFALSALVMCLVLASCGNAASKMESLAKDIEKNGDEWDTEKWTSVIKDALEREIKFYEGMPSEKEIDEYDEACEQFNDAVAELDSKARNKLNKAQRKKEIQKLAEKSRKAERKAKKKIDGDDD